MAMPIQPWMAQPNSTTGGSTATPFMGGGATVNPTGANGTGGITTTWGAPGFEGTTSYPTGGPGDYGYGTSGNPHPVVGTTMNPIGQPTTSMNPGTPGSTGIPSPVVGSKAFAGTFGSGIAPFLANELNTQGGYNSALTQQDVQAQIQAMQNQIQLGYGSLESGLGAAGVNPNSSAAALETSNYMTQATEQENAITAQEYFSMWNQSQNRETQLLESELGPLSGHRGGALQWFDQFSGDMANLFGS